ncbi:MAG: hypothetical protein P4L40_26760 [Terracidiphilus sp.]|nr:hypothetical protein [Terracidiphilus sp.]
MRWIVQFAGGPIALRYTANDALPSAATGGIAVFVTGELAQGAVVSHSSPSVLFCNVCLESLSES